MIVALILARGESESIPKKNIIEINGFPLIYYTIEAAKKSKCNAVWVSTDDMEIKDISKSFGAYVIDRPAEISKNTSSSEEALLHFYNNVKYKIMVFIQPTSPLLEYEYINKGINKLLECSYDSVFSVVKRHWIPTWSIDLKPMWDIKNRPRRQDMPEFYEENGAFYITTRKQFEETRNRYGGKIGIVEMPLSRSFQIDTYQDLELVRKLL